jgi:hypothetical protein
MRPAHAREATMRRARQLVLALITTMALLAGGAAPAHADRPGGGTMEFTATMQLPNFPCAPACTGTMNGVANGVFWSLAGVHLMRDATFAANFNYTDDRMLCPMVSTSNAGNFQAVSGPLVLNGGMTWTRVGTEMLITFRPASLFFNGVAVWRNHAGSSTAVWETPNAVSNCLAGGGALTATVAGAAVFDQAVNI